MPYEISGAKKKVERKTKQTDKWKHWIQTL